MGGWLEKMGRRWECLQAFGMIPERERGGELRLMGYVETPDQILYCMLATNAKNGAEMRCQKLALISR